MTAKARNQKASVAPNKKVKEGGATWRDIPTKLEIAFAHVLMSMETRDVTAAAAKLGLDAARGKKMGASRRVKDYILAYRYHYIESMAETEVRLMVNAGITRQSIAARMWVLANLPPERTQGGISGQVRACISVATLMNFMQPPRDLDDLFKDKSDDQLRNYWQYGSFDGPKKIQ
jgi:hypothetical protein